MPKKKLTRRSLPKRLSSGTEARDPSELSTPSVDTSLECEGKSPPLTPSDEDGNSGVGYVPDQEAVNAREANSPEVMIEESNHAEDVDLARRYKEVFPRIVAEKRAYDFLVNKLNRRIDEVTASKKKGQNELVELKLSVSKLLKEIENIEYDPQTYYRALPVTNEGVRGPPLPTQDELFMQAWDNGQVNKTYTRFSQRQKTSNYHQY